MGEQNRRRVDLEAEALAKAPPSRASPPRKPPAAAGERALGVAADERQTARQAPASAAPGESAQDDSIG